MTTLRDWWRGYSDVDLEKMRDFRERPETCAPGGIVPVTHGELRALIALGRMQAGLAP